MNIKDIITDSRENQLQILKQDSYVNIYKKTEKIVCAVFFVTDSIVGKDGIKDTIATLRSDATELLGTTVQFLSLPGGVGRGEYGDLVRKASTVRSMLYVLVAVQGLAAEFADIIAREIDGVIYNCGKIVDSERERHVVSAPDAPPLYVSEVRRQKVMPNPVVRVAQSAPRATSADAVRVESSSRKDAVLALIKERGDVSIKDISDNIKDCSEKTIQRILIDLIKDNLIVREGERRWSRYKLA